MPPLPSRQASPSLQAAIPRQQLHWLRTEASRARGGRDSHESCLVWRENRVVRQSRPVLLRFMFVVALQQTDGLAAVFLSSNLQGCVVLCYGSGKCEDGGEDDGGE